MIASVPAPYDVNFCFPVRELENQRVKLTPLIPALHANLFFRGSSSSPDLCQHFSIGPYSSASGVIEDFKYDHIPGMMLYAITNKTRSPHSVPGSNASNDGPPSAVDFAGTIGYPEHLSVEIGFVIVLPPFQRTHVTTDAVGLLMRHALDSQTASPPGLGLRRVQWQASERNSASIRAAERMGFRTEARLRWDKVFPGDQGKEGNGEDIRKGDARAGTLGRHTVILAICWYDREGGGRERVARLMDR